MKQINYKKLILPNIPYVFFVYLFDKVGQAVRLAPGADISAKILNITQGFSAAFENALPSVYPLDLLVGIVGAVIIRLIVYVKGKNAKKYRKGAEYGSARWGNAEDIKPYIDPDFQNNIILTQTERLTMNSRPKQPKYARNKNVVVIGGSGSGKTRFFVKPNLMHRHFTEVCPILLYGKLLHLLVDQPLFFFRNVKLHLYISLSVFHFRTAFRYKGLGLSQQAFSANGYSFAVLAIYSIPPPKGGICCAFL